MMGMYGFVKGRGRALASADDVVTPEMLRGELGRLGLKADDVVMRVDGDIVHLSGHVVTQDEKERIILAVGNIQGVAGVVDEIPGVGEPSFYTIVPGDTLRSVAAMWLGCAERGADILAANRPMLDAEDLIYRGQVLRLPCG